MGPIMGEWRLRARDGGAETESEGWGERRLRVRDGGMETVVEDGSETGLVIKGKHFFTGISASLTPDYRDKESNMQCNYLHYYVDI